MSHHPGDAHETAPTLPVETLRNWYVTLCGGWSPELGLFQIGINGEALRRNTSLDPAVDRVRVSVVGQMRRPFLMDRFFEVVPLDERHPDALRFSPGGEVVFPEGDAALRPDQSPHPGQPVILNTAFRPVDKVPDPEAVARILQDILHHGFDVDYRGS